MHAFLSTNHYAYIYVDARQATPEEIGEKFTVYSHGKIEKEFIIQEDTVFLTTLDKNGKPIIDEQGHTNTYDMPLAKFNKKYHLHENGHYVQDPTPIATIKIPEDSIPEQGITVVPPFWGGYEGTLMRGGLIMMPLNTELSNEIDWYPNNEPDTYAKCHENGIFLDEELQMLFKQKRAESLLDS